MAQIDVRVVSPDAMVFHGPSSSLVAPAWDGQVGILPGHAPLVTLLGQGVLDIDLPGGGSDRFHIAGGVMKVENDRVTILTEHAGEEPPVAVPDGLVPEPEDLLEHATAGNPLA